MNEENDLLKCLSSLPDRGLSVEEKHELRQELSVEFNRLAKEHRKRSWRAYFLGGAATAVAVAGIALLIVKEQIPHEQQPPVAITSPNPTASKPGKPSVSNPPAPTTGAQGNNNQTSKNSRQETDEQSAMISQLIELARQGKVPNCPFAAHTSLIDEVKQQWGTPNQEEGAGKGIYATYSQRGFTFGFNHGEQIFDVRSYSKELQTFQLQQVIDVLGQPNQINHYQNQEIFVYNASDLFQLQMIFPARTDANPNPNLDHISVYCAKDAVNYMSAQ